MNINEYYSSNISRYSATLRLLRKRSALISLLRLMAFAGTIFCCFLLFKKFDLTALAGMILLITAFIALVRVSISLTAKRNLTKQLLFVNKNEKAILDGKENEFSWQIDLDTSAMHTTDLDIFGTRSVFHLLNRTTTAHGNKMLASLLNKPMMESDKIIEHQQAIQTLAPQSELRELITAHGLLEKEKEGKIEEVVAWIKSPAKLNSRNWLHFIRIIVPVFNIAAFFYYLDSDNPIPVSIGVIVSWIFTAAHIRYINEQHLLTGKKTTILQQYASILKYFSRTEKGNSAMLHRLQQISGEAYNAIFRLSKLMGALDQRLNLAVNFLLNSFLLYDIQCTIALEKWKIKNEKNFMLWIEAVGNIETVNSLAAFAFNNPGYCYPELNGKAPHISAEQIGHPLMPREEQVANNVVAGVDEKLLLITGSNMSGKSTFLRTLGVNLLLAQCGAPVCARNFRFSPMRILSSIRISDSLQDNTSYFMAELKRLREIISLLETGVPALVLIDEVLRGTNSDDKTHGSEALIIKLIKYNCLSFFASHDLSLSMLESKYPGRISNYCFESKIEDGELSFDYQLHKGVATNKNASFLMQKMGII